MNPRRKNFGMKLHKRKKLALPYYGTDVLKWFYRFIRGPTTKNKQNIQYLPKRFILNNINIKDSLTIVFIGDVMELKERDLIIGNSVKEFARDADYMIGNFEATITNEKRIFMDQRHKIQIIDTLKSLFRPEDLFLSMANNHSGDFGQLIFSDSVKILEDSGFNIFGTIDKPFIDIQNKIRITAGTAWSNRPCDYLINFYDTKKYFNPDLCNILYAHWGYELYYYPNKEVMEIGKNYIENFEAIIGHHSHIPQPVTYYSCIGTNKLIAYSLGDFSYGDDYPKNNLENYRYGIILKLKIGEDVNGRINIKEIEWEFTESNPCSKDNFVVEITNTIPIFEN